MRSVPLIVSLMLFACSNAKLQDSNSEHKSATSDATADNNKDKDQNPDESIAPPAQISGASLLCAEEAVSAAPSSDSLYGCQITDKAGARQTFNPILLPYRIGWKATGAFAANVVAKSLNGDARYDALFYLKAVDQTALASSLANFTVVLQGKAKDGNFHDAVVKPINSITVPASTIPQTSGADYAAIKSTLSVEADNGNPTPPLP